MKFCLLSAVLVTALCAAPAKWERTDRLEAGKPGLLSRDPRCWRKTELRARVTGTYITPFDADQIAVDAEIRSPSGHTFSVPAFFYQEYEDQEIMAGGATEWRVRFTPEEAGRYSIRIHAHDRSGRVTSARLSFSVSAASDHGFLKVSKRDRHYFEFDDGTPYFAVGENMVHGTLADYSRWMGKLSANGGNYGRLWMGYPEGLEIAPLGEYRLDIAWKFDKIIELSEQYGIYQKICIDYIRYISPKGEPRKTFDPEANAYSASNGGPCHNMREFFALPEARRMFKNRLRYLVARWGYSTHIMAWELWNEIGSADKEAVRDHALVIDWNREMCRYLKSIDPRHMTTNSLSSTEVWPDMWAIPENEFAQMHGYYYFSEEMKRDAKDMAGFMTKWLGEIDRFDKPYLFAEFGIVPDKPDTGGLWDKDPRGVHLHNGLWAPLADGAAGTGMIWWWHNYIDPKDLYFQFRPVAEFVKGIPWTTEAFQHADLASSSEGLRALGLAGKHLILLWLQNRAHTWWNVTQQNPIEPVEKATVTVKSVTDGRYRVEYFDTWKGAVIESSEISAENGVLRISVPTLERDLAIKIAHESSQTAVHTDFEGGSLGKIEKVSETHFRLAVKGESDENGRNRQANWYYFRVDGAASQPLTLDIVNLPGEYNYQPNKGAITKDTPPVISYDGIHWEHVKDYEYDLREPKLRLRIQPRHARFWIAHCAPYTNQTLAKLRNEIQDNADFQEEAIGKTVGGRELVLWTITQGESKGKPTIWLMFRQHSWESGSSWVGEGAIRTLLAGNSESKSLRDRAIWKIFPLCDPDGVARGGVRFNSNGFDLNRNWDVVDPVKMPEITAQRNAVRQWLRSGNRIDLFLSLHNTETGEYLEGPPQFKALGERLFQILTEQSSFAPTRPFSLAEKTTTLGKTGRMTVAQGLNADFGIAAFIMEQRIAYNSKLGYLPEVADRLKFGEALVKGLAQTVAESRGDSGHDGALQRGLVRRFCER